MEIPGLSIIPVLFVVLIVIPGVFAKRFYFSGVFAKQFGSGTFADRLITSIFWGFIIQVITYLLYSKAFNFTILDIKESLVNAYSDLSANKLPRDFDKYDLWMLLGYVIASVLISALAGNLGYRLIRLFKIDINFNSFRYSNQWHYYFSGEILGTKHFFAAKKKIVSTSADVLVSNGDNMPKLVSGILKEYTLGKNGELETIILAAARRFSKTENCYKDIPGDYMIIPYNKVIDLNITYGYPSPNEQSTKLDTILKALFSAFILISFSIIIFAPWFLGYSFISTVLRIFGMTVGFMFGILTFGLIFNKESRDKFGLNIKIISAIISLMGCYLIYNTLHLSQFFNYIIEVIKKLIA